MDIKYYKVPIENGMFVGVDYIDIIEGIAFEKHVEQGYGYIMTQKEYPFEEIPQEQFEAERMI
jgi:hypothetical protein